MTALHFNRRDFLKTTAAAVAAPYVITSTALGNADTPPASERVALGHIGVGGRGGELVPRFQQCKGCRAWRWPTPTRTAAKPTRG